MKNVIFGLVGSLIIVYTAALALGIYNMNVRKNELDNCLSAVMENTMTDYYESLLLMNEEFIPPEAVVKEQLTENILQRLKNPEDTHVDVKVCDIEKGIISVIVREDFGLPGGIDKEIACRKTIIVDRE